MESVQLIEDDVTRRSEPALKCLEKAKGGMKRVGSTIGSLLAMSFSRFLGPEVSGKFIILFCFFIVGLLFFYRKVSLKKKSRLFFFIYVSILVLLHIIILYCYDMLGVAVLSTILFYGSGSGQSLPLPAPSGSEGSSSWTGKTSFEEQVLSEPFPEPETEATSANPATPFNRNASLEMSIRNRISRLEMEESPFLLGKERGQYWGEVKEALDRTSYYGEYLAMLDFENTDLQLREIKQQCFSLYKSLLAQNPNLAANAPQSPDESILSFFEEISKEMEPIDSRELTYREEIKLIQSIIKNIEKYGCDSYYIKRILDFL